MGRRIVQVLEQGGVEAQVAGRRGPILANVHAPAPFLETLTSGDVVIDAVGPYLHDPRLLVQGCLERGAHYIDLSESPEFQASVRAALQDWSGTPRSAIATGCSTIPAMADALMSLIERPGDDIARRVVWLSMGTRNPVSAALMYSLLRPLGRRHRHGRWWRELRTCRLGDGRTPKNGSYPAPWPRERQELWSGFDRSIYAWLLWFASFSLPLCPDRLLWWGCILTRPLVSMARWVGTRRGNLRLELHSTRGEVRALEVRAQRDGLMIPACPAAWAAQALLQRVDIAGEVQLSALLSGKEIAARLQAMVYVVKVLER